MIFPVARKACYGFVQQDRLPITGAQPMHVTDLFFLGARNAPNRLALSGKGGDFTYRETQALSNRIARVGKALKRDLRAPYREGRTRAVS